MEKLQDVEKLSFGFTGAIDQRYTKSLQKYGYDYDRVIYDLGTLEEISLLKGKLPAYPQTKVFSGNSLEAVEQKEAVSDFKEMKAEKTSLDLSK